MRGDVHWTRAEVRPLVECHYVNSPSSSWLRSHSRRAWSPADSLGVRLGHRRQRAPTRRVTEGCAWRGHAAPCAQVAGCASLCGYHLRGLGQNGDNDSCCPWACCSVRGADTCLPCAVCPGWVNSAPACPQRRSVQGDVRAGLTPGPDLAREAEQLFQPRHPPQVQAIIHEEVAEKTPLLTSTPPAHRARGTGTHVCPGETTEKGLCWNHARRWAEHTRLLNLGEIPRSRRTKRDRGCKVLKIPN